MKNDYKEFHAADGSDEWIVKHIKNLPDKGTFVEVGAASAIYRNNTYHFEKNGWQGICIDADPHWFAKCDGSCHEPASCLSLTEHRKTSANIAIGLDDKDITFNQCDRHVLSHRSDADCKGNSAPYIEIPLKQMTLNSIVDLYAADKMIAPFKHIDLMSIDCEGMDYEVWESFNGKKYPVKILIIEQIFDSEKTKNLMKSHSEHTLVWESKANLIYIHSSILSDYVHYGHNVVCKETDDKIGMQRRHRLNQQYIMEDNYMKSAQITNVGNPRIIN